MKAEYDQASMRQATRTVCTESEQLIRKLQNELAKLHVFVTGFASLQDLIEYLQHVPAGEITEAEDVRTVKKLLQRSWGRMNKTKLTARMENVCWDPPLLTFQTEKHRPAKFGSNISQLQEWTLDSATGNVALKSERTRINAPRFFIKKAVEELAEVAIAGRPDPRLNYEKDGTIRIEIRNVLPETSYKSTRKSRSKRFRRALDDILLNSGFVKVREKVYRKKEEIDDLDEAECDQSDSDRAS